MKFKLTIDGKTYEVDVEASESEQRRPDHATLGIGSARTPTASLTPAAHAAPAGGTAVDESKVCRSPIAGVVVRVSAQVGQSIQANDVLMVLEAMKMETSITSPVAGKVAKVNSAVGDAVTGGQVLVEFE
ncbi:MAG TPA: acetyl-CoA carboxylase biotin carboxyl carrier protein subunit [Lacipirellulaceae bacterium]|nr:acetyl-CoA carboxylase biotin carboxyl carrier protein subunit [Lacipirellulaceae bacterium]HMP05846.1 acetyl-CoA carboxylase biotin carboxyl carrier protein subunit [Lacipirellulaceae bacterium]